MKLIKRVQFFCLAAFLFVNLPLLADELSPELLERISKLALDDKDVEFIRLQVDGLDEIDRESFLDYLAAYPGFDEEKATGEFNSRMPPPEQKYSDKLLAAAKVEAAKRFTVFKKGETITVPIPYGARLSRDYTGIYHGIFVPEIAGREGSLANAKVKIGERYFMLKDFSGEIQEKFNDEIMRERYSAYVKRKYYVPRKSYMTAYSDQLVRHLEERRKLWRDTRRQSLREFRDRLVEP